MKHLCFIFSWINFLFHPHPRSPPILVPYVFRRHLWRKQIKDFVQRGFGAALWWNNRAGKYWQGNNRIISFHSILFQPHFPQTMSSILTNSSGFDYVGWSTGSNKYLTMVFSFDDVRNFSKILFYCNTNQAVGARWVMAFFVFSKLLVQSFNAITNNK